MAAVLQCLGLHSGTVCQPLAATDEAEAGTAVAVTVAGGGGGWVVLVVLVMEAVRHYSGGLLSSDIVSSAFPAAPRSTECLMHMVADLLAPPNSRPIPLIQ